MHFIVQQGKGEPSIAQHEKTKTLPDDWIQSKVGPRCYDDWWAGEQGHFLICFWDST
jgi:hypothetical protein